MAELLLVPEVAAGATEVVISHWLVEPGQDFKSGEAIVVLETEKAVVEVEAETDATLLRWLVPAGSVAEVGRPMALLGSPAEVGSDLDAALASLGVPAAQEAGTSRQDGQDSADVPTPRPAVGGDLGVSVSAAKAPAGTQAADRGRRFISPIARKMLADAGLAVDSVTGTGPDGRIVRRDVEAAIRAHAANTTTTTGGAQVTEARHTSVPHSRLRKAVARRLTESKRDVPHFYLKRSVAIDDLLRLRAELNAHSPVRVSVNDFILRAVALAHQAVPQANVIWTDEEMLQFDAVDVAVAVASERGLVTPVVRGVEARSLTSISAEVKRLVDAANAGTLQQSDLEGGTISVTNLGMFGVEEFSAIINPPQSAILAVGAAVPSVRIVDGEATTVSTISLVMSVDHRAIDGALAAKWMAALADALEHPFSLVV